MFSLSSVPAVLLPPVVFTGLLITLWTYKCLMMIIFQNKIIYMPSMPPFSRSEKVEDYAGSCKPVIWTEHSIRSEDGTPLKLLEGQIPHQQQSGVAVDDNDNNNTASITPRYQHVVTIYFQGNGSSLPPRIPYLSNILKRLQDNTNTSNNTSNTSATQYTIIALSYRGFWKSKGRPTQRGIELDAQAALSWVSQHYTSAVTNTQVILWGQSIGAGVATTALATWQDRRRSSGSNNSNSKQVETSPNSLPVTGLLLETPFTSLRAMLISLYPQKFLPYRYLGPFLMSTWDSVDALSRIGRGFAQQQQQDGNEHGLSGMVDGSMGKKEKKRHRLKVLLLEAENDELVPKEDAATLYELCKEFEGFHVKHSVVSGALHTNVMMKGSGKREIVEFLRGFEQGME